MNSFAQEPLSQFVRDSWLAGVPFDYFFSAPIEVQSKARVIYPQLDQLLLATQAQALLKDLFK